MVLRFAILIGLFVLSAVVPFSLADCGTGPAPGVINCTEKFFNQNLDHFGWQKKTFNQRYFIYDKYYTLGGPMLFYTGNEADVELYVNCTGLMWENAESLGALMVFAEHRYYGKSLPCAGGFAECGDWFSTEQAMADYSVLITFLRNQYRSGATIALGGSYGGMLSAWMRMRYPLQVDGAIASSAPIGCMSPQYKNDSYWKVVSRSASSQGGSRPNCSFEIFKTLSEMEEGIANSKVVREEIKEIFQLCKPLSNADGSSMTLWIQSAFDSLAMGNYPFSTYYIAGTPENPMPAWPMRKACEFMEPTTAGERRQRLANLKAAVDVINNATLNVPCYDVSSFNPSSVSDSWDFLVCTEDVPNEIPYFTASGWPNDMFPYQKPYTIERLNTYCDKTYGHKPRIGYLDSVLGVSNVPYSSNIIFANGLLDPWSSGGILNNVSETVLAYHIPEGAHHLDLFFSTPEDPESVRFVRKEQIANIKKWQVEYARKIKQDHVSGKEAVRLH